MGSMLRPGARRRGGWRCAPRLRWKARPGESVARHPWPLWGIGAVWVAAIGLLFVPRSAHAAREEFAAQEYSARIYPRAIEVGVAGSLTSVEGATRADVTLRGGTFTRAGTGLTGIEAQVSYGHVASLDVVDLEGAVSVLKPVGSTALYPYLAASGGLRQEKLGSFRQVRYPVGFDAGLRSLMGPRAGIRLEYRYRRILRDPVADYTEHQILAGLSLFFRNSQPPQRGMRLPRFPKVRKVR